MIGCLSKYLVTSPYWTISFRWSWFSDFHGLHRQVENEYFTFLRVFAWWRFQSVPETKGKNTLRHLFGSFSQEINLCDMIDSSLILEVTVPLCGIILETNLSLPHTSILFFPISCQIKPFPKFISQLFNSFLVCFCSLWQCSCWWWIFHRWAEI